MPSDDRILCLASPDHLPIRQAFISFLYFSMLEGLILVISGEEVLEDGAAERTCSAGYYECLVFKGFGDLHLFINSPLVNSGVNNLKLLI